MRTRCIEACSDGAGYDQIMGHGFPRLPAPMLKLMEDALPSVPKAAVAMDGGSSGTSVKHGSDARLPDALLVTTISEHPAAESHPDSAIQVNGPCNTGHRRRRQRTTPRVPEIDAASDPAAVKGENQRRRDEETRRCGGRRRRR
jgi:hypothetical protein